MPSLIISQFIIFIYFAHMLTGEVKGQFADSFYLMGSRDLNLGWQAGRLASKFLYPLSHPTIPISQF